MQNRHRLGVEGERLATKMLERGGFTNVEPLPVNYHWADFRARRNIDPESGHDTHSFAWNGRRTTTNLHVISVKARNKRERGGSLNSRYLLGNECLRKMLEALADHHDEAIPSFLVFAFEPETLDCYFGYMEKLRTAGLNCTGIPMSLAAPARYGYQKLADSEVHGLDHAALTNLLGENDLPIAPDRRLLQQHQAGLEGSAPASHKAHDSLIRQSVGPISPVVLQEWTGPFTLSLSPTERIAYEVLAAAAPNGLAMTQLKPIMRQRGCIGRSFYEVFNRLVGEGLAAVVKVNGLKRYSLVADDRDSD